MPTRLMIVLSGFCASYALAESAAPLDPTSELAPPPFIVTGPEQLDEAIEKAKSIDHPNYTQKKRYQRSTHISFPLTKADGSDLGQTRIEESGDDIAETYSLRSNVMPQGPDGIQDQAQTPSLATPNDKPRDYSQLPGLMRNNSRILLKTR